MTQLADPRFLAFGATVSTSHSSTVEVDESPRIPRQTSGTVETVAQHAEGLRAALTARLPLVFKGRIIEPSSMRVEFRETSGPLRVLYGGVPRLMLHFGAGSGTEALQIEMADLGSATQTDVRDSHSGEGNSASIRIGATQASTPPLLDELGRQVAELLDEEPVEAGEPHPAETILTAAAGTTGFESWLRSLYAAKPNLRRSLVLSIGRLHLTAEKQQEARGVIAAALADPSLQVREAAVRALETLDAIARELLASYDERVPWLKSYAERVYRRLSE